MALITFLLILIWFAIRAPHFVTSLSIADIATLSSIMGIIVVDLSAEVAE